MHINTQVNSGSRSDSKKIPALGYNIFLIGFMGTGKSTISGYLSQAYSMETVEMDEEISKREGMGIPEIFDTYGEEYFRGLETGLLEELQGKSNTVVSCGGGVPMRGRNVDEMKKSGKIVLLTASPETVYGRVKDSHDRPLLENNKSVAYISELMEKRRAKYEAAADIVIKTDGQDVPAICAQLFQKLSGGEG